MFFFSRSNVVRIEMDNMNNVLAQTMQVLVPSSFLLYTILMMSSSVPKEGRSLASWANFWGVARILLVVPMASAMDQQVVSENWCGQCIELVCPTQRHVRYCVSLVVSVRHALTMGMHLWSCVASHSARVNSTPMCDWEIVEKCPTLVVREGLY
jgi:hypothetical protein